MNAGMGSLRVAGLVAALACAAALAGCGGGGSGSSAAPLPGASAAPGSLQSVRVTMTIAGPPGTKASGSARTPKFVSPSTNGVLIAAYLHSDTQHTTVIATSATDVSSGSAACGGQIGFPRTCAGVVPVPAGNDDFVITTYDAAPAGGVFGGTAHVLGRDTVNQTIGLDVANSLSIFISGVIASYGSSQSYASLPADGATKNFAFVLQPQDFDNNPIAAGTNDPYANPITVTLAETGGGGHSTLVFNGNAVGATATLTHSTDTLALRYDGLGAPGYTTLTTLSAGGVTNSSIRVSPLYVGSASTYFSAASLSFAGSGESAQLAATEANPPGTVTYTATPSAGCSGIAAASISGANATVTSGATAAAFGPCSVSISDGTSTVTVGVANTISGVPITIGGFTLTTYTPADADGGVTVQYGSITVGPDGALWVWEELTPANGVGHVSRITSSGTMTQFPVPGTGSFGYGVAAGADANLWFTVYNHDQVDRMTTAGVVTAFPAGGSNPKGITAGPDGNVWYTLFNAAAIGRITPAGTVTTFPLPAGYGFPEYITAGPDGNLWFQSINPVNAIGRITPAGVITMFPLPNTSGQPGGITAGPDGNVWFGELSTFHVGRITPTGTITEFAAPYARIDFLTTAADGNLWFTSHQGSNRVGKITPAGISTGFVINTATNINGAQLVSAPDGNLWLAGFFNVSKLQY
jgi:streptogramin lyase